MRDYLLDIVQHTCKLGGGIINLVKITGTDSETAINAYDSVTRTVVLNAKFKKPIPEFIGVFGMPSLDKLNTILNIPEYSEDAVITINKQQNDDGTSVPSSMSIKNKSGDFKNEYRFMGTTVVNEQLKNALMKPVKWNVTITPSVASIQKLKFQLAAHGDSIPFSTKVEDGNLKFYFGDPSSTAGNFVFAADCGGTSAKQLYWPASVVNNILSLPGDKTLKISDEGVAEITVDSGIAEYTYKIPAQTK